MTPVASIPPYLVTHQKMGPGLAILALSIAGLATGLILSHSHLTLLSGTGLLISPCLIYLGYMHTQLDALKQSNRNLQENIDELSFEFIQDKEPESYVQTATKFALKHTVVLVVKSQFPVALSCIRALANTLC